MLTFNRINLLFSSKPLKICATRLRCIFYSKFRVQWKFASLKNILYYYFLQSPGGATMVDRLGIPGWEVVEELTDGLLSTIGSAYPQQKVQELVNIIGRLHEYDRQKTKFSDRVGTEPSIRNLRISRMSSVTPKVDSTKRLEVIVVFVAVLL